MQTRQIDRAGKEGAALIMVMLSGMLIVILGIGMLFFYQKQVERRMKVEFDIHRRLAAKSGFNMVQYSGFNGTGTYHYATANNRPDIWVTIGEAEPIYTEDFLAGSLATNWSHYTDGETTAFSVTNSLDGFVFDTSSGAVNIRNELGYLGPKNFSWNEYPFGLCYDLKFSTSPEAEAYPWIGYMFVGASNTVSTMLTSNTVAAISVKGVPDEKTQRVLGLHDYSSGTGVLSANNVLTKHFDTGWPVETELYLDKSSMAYGAEEDVDSEELVYGNVQLSTDYSAVSNVFLSIGGFSHASATNYTIEVSKFVVRPPYEYEIRLSWTNRNRYFGETDIALTTNVLATVVDKTLGKNQYFIFDSFETVVGE